MFSDEQIAEAISESLRQSRRSFVKPFDLGSVVLYKHDNDNNNHMDYAIELKIIDDNVVRTFTLWMQEDKDAPTRD
jgi:hypothetical protein